MMHVGVDVRANSAVKEKTMLNVEFPCEIESEVRIKLTQVVGVVKGWMVDEDGIKFALVMYADDTKAVHSDWIREGELALPVV